MLSLTRRKAMSVLIPSLGFISAARRKRLSLSAAIDQEIATTTALGSAFLGALVVRVVDGKVLYQRNEGKLFVPASNAKLFTTALALARLGPDYRFYTSVIAEGPVDSSGHLQGDLVLVGRGDPSLSSRTYPYTTDPSTGDALQPIEELADQVTKGGLRSITGDIAGDDTRYPWAPHPSGWTGADETWDYGAPVSALVVNDNSLALVIAPGESEGDLARVSFSPAIEYFTILNAVRTDAASGQTIHVERQPGSREIGIWGRIGMGENPAVQRLAAADPALFAAKALRDALTRRGVAIRGESIARHRLLGSVPDIHRAERPQTPAPGPELARRTSPPLIQLAQVVDKVSQNLHAEILLREVGAVRRNVGTLAAGLAELSDFLEAAGISGDDTHLRDGSGLSGNALVTPRAIVKLLLYLYQSSLRDQFLTLLPVGGEDGSLRTRFRGHPEAHDIRAKTGTLSDVNALSGYALSHQHGLVAFSFVVNNVSAESGKMTKFLDNIGLKLLL